MEEWRDVKGYEGFYKVSNTGVIKSVDRLIKQINNGVEIVTRYKGKTISQTKDSRGYMRVHISKNGKDKYASVHRIVAEAFVPKPNNCNIVNHLDCNPSNNIYSNLEWTTHKGNMEYASMLGRMHYNKNNLAKAQELKKVSVIASKDGIEQVFSSIEEAKKKLGIKSRHISQACRKEYGYKTVCGYEWRYYDEEKNRSVKPKKVARNKEEIRNELSERMKGNNYCKGKILSDTTKSKISLANSIPVAQYTKDGTLVCTYKSITEAKIKTKINHIDACVRKERKSAGGYIWERI